MAFVVIVTFEFCPQLTPQNPTTSTTTIAARSALYFCMRFFIVSRFRSQFIIPRSAGCNEGKSGSRCSILFVFTWVLVGVLVMRSICWRCCVLIVSTHMVCVCSLVEPLVVLFTQVSTLAFEHWFGHVGTGIYTPPIYEELHFYENLIEGIFISI